MYCCWNLGYRSWTAPWSGTPPSGEGRGEETAALPVPLPVDRPASRVWVSWSCLSYPLHQLLCNHSECTDRKKARQVEDHLYSVTGSNSPASKSKWPLTACTRKHFMHPADQNLKHVMGISVGGLLYAMSTTRWYTSRYNDFKICFGDLARPCILWMSVERTSHQTLTEWRAPEIRGVLQMPLFLCFPLGVRQK